MATIAAANIDVEPSSPSLHSTGSKHENITCIDGELYMAAVEGNFNKFTKVIIRFLLKRSK